MCCGRHNIYYSVIYQQQSRLERKIVHSTSYSVNIFYNTSDSVLYSVHCIFYVTVANTHKYINKHMHTTTVLFVFECVLYCTRYAMRVKHICMYDINEKSYNRMRLKEFEEASLLWHAAQNNFGDWVRRTCIELFHIPCSLTYMKWVIEHRIFVKLFFFVDSNQILICVVVYLCCVDCVV